MLCVVLFELVVVCLLVCVGGVVVVFDVLCNVGMCVLLDCGGCVGVVVKLVVV